MSNVVEFESCINEALKEMGKDRAERLMDILKDYMVLEEESEDWIAVPLIAAVAEAATAQGIDQRHLVTGLGSGVHSGNTMLASMEEEPE